MRSAFAPRTVLITGGASGIGLALGRQLARHGTEVTLTDIDGDAAHHAAARLRRHRCAGVVHAFVLDVRDESAFHVAVQAASSTTGTLDALFNDAGISLGWPTEELTSAHWDRIIDVNLRGVVNGILAAYPKMTEQGGGHIANTASGVGLVAPTYVTAYATTKHAVVGLSTGLRAEAARHGVSVSVLYPGSAPTGFATPTPRPRYVPGSHPRWSASASDTRPLSRVLTPRGRRCGQARPTVWGRGLLPTSRWVTAADRPRRAARRSAG